MRILGVDLPRPSNDRAPVEYTLVLLDGGGKIAGVERAASLPEVATTATRLATSEPFLLGVNVPVVVPAKSARTRPVEQLVRRRLGYRMAAGGRAALSAEPQGVAGETLMAGLAAAGHPCLPYPDRNRRQSGLAESQASLITKALLWERSPIVGLHDRATREELLRAWTCPPYRLAEVRASAGWAERAGAMDLLLRLLDPLEGYDLQPARDALTRASDDEQIERAGGLLDASLIAGTARRYLEAPETCLFLGDQESGYLILPADGFIRSIASSDSRKAKGRLFPSASLRERLGPDAQLRPVELLTVPGRPQRTEARFKTPPQYEFDNLDEMLWWKHCRHLSGLRLPTEGLHELQVALGRDAAVLNLVRSRHATLSFRFEPPSAWRSHLPTRDGKTYPFRVLRAVYETAATAD